MSFETLGLHPLLVQTVAKAGYEIPTPVQKQAIPEAIAGRDLMVSSETGSGKTAAFMLPALHALTTPTTLPGKGPRVVVLTPTRELAMQVTKACEVYGKVLPNLRTLSVLGGVPYAHQQRMLRQFIDVMVATPGRLIDYIQRGMVDFSRVEMLVLDEADRMLDMGFIEDIEHIVSKMPKKRQTLMFSATFGGSVGRVAQQWLNDPLPITVASHSDTHANIEQRLHYTRGYSNKVSVLEHLLKDETLNQAIVFTATQREADSLSDTLLDQGFVSAPLHGGMNQRQRNRTLQEMRQGRLRVLVATDVAARGLDVQGISHVINFDLPKMAEDYVHRIGRTGRAGRQGVALTLADINERRHVQRIERFTTQNIPVHGIEGLAPIPTEMPKGSAGRGNGGGGGGGRSRSGSDSRFGSGSSGSGRPRFGGGSDDRQREYRGGGGGFGGRSSGAPSSSGYAHPASRERGRDFGGREGGNDRQPQSEERGGYEGQRRSAPSQRNSSYRSSSSGYGGGGSGYAGSGERRPEGAGGGRSEGRSSSYGARTKSYGAGAEAKVPATGASYNSGARRREWSN
ncbi:MAG: DEAD/DEAH box helicase [Pseudomonadota bacterium]